MTFVLFKEKPITMIKKLLFALIIFPSVLVAQNTIKGTFTPAEEFKFAFLYKVTSTTSLFVNNADVNEDGSFTINLDSTATKGMYRIVYAQPQDEYNFDFIYNNEDIELTYSLDKGLDFIASKENKLLMSYRNSISLVSQNINAFYSNSNQKEKEFKRIFKTLKDTQNEFENASEGTIASHFIKASRPYFPSEFEDAETFSENLKNHYFDHVDYNDQVLQNSGFLIDTSLNYVFTFINQDYENTSYNNNIDDVVNAIGDSNSIKHIILEVLWNQFADPQYESVANYIATTYLLDIAKTSNDTELIEKLILFKNTSLGETAPDFTLEIPKDDTVELIKLSDYNEAERYVVVFWSSTCSHCLEELPKLQDYSKSFEKDRLQIIAIGLEDEPYRWKDKTYELSNFLHVYGEGRWENEIGNAYGVTATPTYFVLDANKKIIDKPVDFEAFKIFNNEKPFKIKDSDVKQLDIKEPLIKED